MVRAKLCLGEVRRYPMLRFAAIVGLAALLPAACAPAPLPAQPVLPTFLPAEGQAEAPPPESNEAYPTAQASVSTPSQSVGGFSVALRRAWRDGKQVNAEVCFTLPDASDWTVWEARFQYQETSVPEFSSALLAMEEGQPGQPAQRCDQLSFFVPPDADLSTSTLTVDAVGAYPSAEEYCSLYLPKIQQALADRGIDLTLECPPVEGSPSLQIVDLPEGMSQAEAEELVFSEDFYTVRGPWSFPVAFPP